MLPSSTCKSKLISDYIGRVWFIIISCTKITRVRKSVWPLFVDVYFVEVTYASKFQSHVLYLLKH